MPQVHKHQKRSAENLSSVLLTDYSNKLFRCLQSCYWERSIWRNFKTEVEMLAKSVYDYASYLRDENNVKVIDSEVCVDKVTNKSVKNYENLQKFFDHCCQARHYSFCIKKCGVDGCNICKPIRLPCEVFDKISFLPDPVPQNDGIKDFKEVFGTVTTEDHRPSLQKRLYRENSVPFPVSIQHATNMVVQCEECGMWLIVYSKYKLTDNESKIIKSILDNYAYTCGSSMEDLNLCGKFSTACVHTYCSLL